MSEHQATVRWARGDAAFDPKTYSLDHALRLNAGAELAMSGAPQFRGDATRTNPEDLLVAALSSCHMLTFLAIAARAGLSLDAYEDHASAWLEKGPDGHVWMARATLRPKVTWSAGVEVPPDRLVKLHRDAHAACFIARSVKTDVTIDAPL